jgi:hypothetical protein
MVHAVLGCRSRAGLEAHCVLLADQRAGQLGDDEGSRIRAGLSVIGLGNLQNVAGVLDEYVLEAASGADQRYAPLPCRGDRPQRTLHASVGAGRGDPEAGVPSAEGIGGRDRVGRDPLPSDPRVIERRLECLMGAVAGPAVADDPNQHG